MAPNGYYPDLSPVRYIYVSTSNPDPQDVKLKQDNERLKRENARLLREIHQLRNRRK